MTRIPHRFHAVLIALAWAWAATAPAGAEWYLGNLHSHSARSNDTAGALARTPAQMAQIYADGGFDFLCISDHDTGTTNGGASITDSSSLSVMAGGSYIFLGITGSEVSNHRPHIGAPGTRDLIPKNVADTMQRMQAVYDRGGTPILNHPRWSNNMGTTNLATADAIYALGNFRLVEVWNTNTISSTQDPLVGHADLDTWDLVLNRDMYLLGIGADDCHYSTDNLDNLPKAMTSAAMVRAATLSWENIRAGLLAGDSYSVVRPHRTAPWCTLDEQVVSPTGIYVDSPNAVALRFIVYDLAGNQLAMPAVSDGAADANPSDGLSGDLRAGTGIAARYRFTGVERYARAIATNANGAHAISQPSFRLSVPARHLVAGNACMAFDTIGGATEAALSWYRSEDPAAAEQVIERNDAPPEGDSKQIATLPMSATQYFDTQIVPGATYAYRIITRLGDGRPDRYSETLLVGQSPSVNSNLFSLDFADAGQMCLLRIQDDPSATSAAPSSWSIAAGVMRQDSNIYAEPAAGGNYLGTYAVLNLPTKTDYVFEFDMTSGDNDTFGCVWRYQSPRDCYSLQWDAQRGLLRVLSYTGSQTPAVVADKSSPNVDFVAYTSNATYHVQVVAAGSTHAVTITGGGLSKPIVLEFTDGAHAAGAPGFYCWGNTPATFDEVVFQTPQDDTPTPTPTATLTPTDTLTPTPTSAGPADLWRDGRENAFDLLVFSFAWGGSETEFQLPEDLVDDGTIDASDLLKVIERLQPR